ncbi:MAG: 4Fe-4S binding protein [Ktedonobacteraceae bacterium]
MSDESCIGCATCVGYCPTVSWGSAGAACRSCSRTIAA